MEANFIESIRKQFEYYKLLAEQTFLQLEDKDLFWQFNPESNSIAIIVNHLWSNMKSRWTDFLTSDGEKPWRNRDREFENVIDSKTELIDKWNEGWNRLFQALQSITPDDLEREIYIRNQGHTVMEAINRQAFHSAYHIRQIVYIGRMAKGNEWKTLSIPKNKSEEYNLSLFSKEKKRTHFTDEFLDNSKNKPQQ